MHNTDLAPVLSATSSRDSVWIIVFSSQLVFQLFEPFQTIKSSLGPVATGFAYSFEYSNPATFGQDAQVTCEWIPTRFLSEALNYGTDFGAVSNASKDLGFIFRKGALIGFAQRNTATS
jgi:hypothetical protein